MICAQLGEKPDPERMPLELDDFPLIVRDSIDIFNRLGDRYETLPTGLLYIGKDYTTLDVLFNIYDVHCTVQKQEMLDIIQHLDYKAVAKSVEAAKREARRIKNGG